MIATLFEEMRFRRRKWLEAQARLCCTPVPTSPATQKEWDWACTAAADRAEQFKAAQAAFRAARRRALEAPDPAGVTA